MSLGLILRRTVSSRLPVLYVLLLLDAADGGLVIEQWRRLDPKDIKYWFECHL